LEALANALAESHAVYNAAQQIETPENVVALIEATGARH
jgi:hypothetical protein